MISDSILKFLKSNGFKLIDKNVENFFGDYCQLFVSERLELRFSSSKSFEAVDIRSCQPNESWYDLALVRAFLYGETKLNNVTSINKHFEFLQKEISNISELFSSNNYPKTKEKLEKLGNERAKQMFPKLYHR